MRKAYLILFTIPIILILSGLIANNLDTGKENKQEPYRPPICGNNICEEDEEDYCLDCNLSCESEFCNSKINIICNGCTETQKKLLPTLFEHQNIVYDCLSDYYGYNPSRLISHTVTKGAQDDPCAKKEGCFISGGGIAERNGIRQGFIPGLREYNETDVTKPENVGFEVHEFAHVFTSLGLGSVQSWFTEGISIYTESRILCHTDQVQSDKIDEFLPLYNKVKANEISLDEVAPYDEYYKVEHNSHRIGSMYFGALEQDYDCDKNCIAQILLSLHEYRENCTGTCFENAKKASPSYSELMNISLNNNDLRIPVITNKIIKKKSEEVIKQDLTALFKLLEIGY